MVVERGRALHNTSFAALLILVGAAAFIWGIYELIIVDPVSNLIALFDITLGGTIIFATFVFVLPEAAVPEPVPLRTYLGATAVTSEKLSLDSLNEYLEVLDKIDTKWSGHIAKVTAQASEPDEPPSPPPSKEKSRSETLIESEVLAFYSAKATGIPRSANEDALTYVSRSQAGTVSKDPPEDMVVARVCSSDVLEAHRTLSPAEFERLTRVVGGHLTEIGERIGIIRSATESMDDYASRVWSSAKLMESVKLKIPKPVQRVIHRAPESSSSPEKIPPDGTQSTSYSSTPTSVPASPPLRPPTLSQVPGITRAMGDKGDNANKSLVWSLTLFQGFLKSYFSTEEIEEISRETLEAKLPPGSPVGSELLQHSRLVRNAIIAAKSRSNSPEELDRILSEMDRFVATLVETGFT
ncbi:MAG: hypothetical protein M1144_02810 [Candidatus Thermoplasmatota archaeon]|nr:hypothetical protein [Candidatus Thermoplasmatota archaeon]MCL5984314.1 hypothetical protein [Candidatus Thermoplasmatota archaeon]